MPKTSIKALAFAVGLLLPGAAMAVPAIVTADLNVRTGPGTRHARLDTIPYRHQVEVRGCLRNFNWCRVSWIGRDGWVSGNYLAYLQRGYRPMPLPDVGLSIGVPIIRFEIGRDDRYRPPPPWWRDRRDWWRWRHEPPPWWN